MHINAILGSEKNKLKLAAKKAGRVNDYVEI
jgi:hypothetical protein